VTGVTVKSEEVCVILLWFIFYMSSEYALCDSILIFLVCCNSNSLL